MNLSFTNITDSEFQKFAENFSGESTFLQNTMYGKFRTQVGENILYCGIFEGKKIIGAALIQKITTKVKTYLHCPHGPLIENEKAWSFFLQNYKQLGKTENCDFVRVSPLLPNEKKSADFFREAKYRSAPIHLVNPERTWVLDLTQSEDDILKNMRKSTRYEVRRIEKTGITVQQGNNTKALDTFWNLHLETVKRQGFTPFPRNNTEKELTIFGENAQIFSAFVDKKPYSSSIILFDKNAGYYHQGSSIYSKVPVAHATIWAAIKEAKKRGCQEFNFWGVVAESETKHPWYGLSKFKRGFGGTEKQYLHCQDYPLTWKYWLSAALESFRKWKRGY